MAFSINHVTLLGNVTKEPELRYTPAGVATTNLNIATNRSVKKGDTYTDVATFHRVVIWGKMAEFIAKSVHKGQKVYVDGRVENRSYDQNGTKHYISEVVAENVIPMSQVKSMQETVKPMQPASEPQPPEEQGSPTVDGKPVETVNPDDIPF